MSLVLFGRETSGNTCKARLGLALIGIPYENVIIDRQNHKLIRTPELMRGISFAGSAEAVTAILGGHIDVMILGRHDCESRAGERVEGVSRGEPLDLHRAAQH